MRRIKSIVKVISRRIKVYGKPKIFCIGLNKTGTTSLEKEMLELGFIVGNQMKGTKLLYDWSKRDFNLLRKLCNSAEFFQDAPFSYPFTFIVLDQMFPNSKFILTERDNAEVWYNSLTKFHSKLWGDGLNPPTIQELKKAPGPNPGFRYDSMTLVKNVPLDQPYKKEVLIDYYETHNKYVKEYFRHTKNKLLTINVSIPEDYKRFCDFIGRKTEKSEFPWENKTKNL
ncbi:sulfotransferase [Mesonia sp. K7]|uniref:sulfotransferase n=1 Tax=Mesonia sp. K7 TaxID=2218606 RepID=UPI000DA9C7BF|nr:sulfotransferase [Mesonia sp. K7]PZD76607.1 hypothetical protein DNG35_11490 [Mesonia sp. K7]